MLKQLSLTNFRKHEDLIVDFCGGLQVIRGLNEQGKSTLFEAIGYALWGSRALPESLEETVTWGKAPKTLKVVLAFDHEGTDYTISRTKSGAELKGANDVTANGHAEVTAFVERLFRASAQVGAATLLATQGSLKEGLKANSISLIEKLSNMGLIDDFVKKIQERLPCGNTKLLEQRLVELESTKAPVKSYGDLPEQLRVAVEQLANAQNAYDALHATGAALADAARAAHQRLEAAENAKRDRTRLAQEISALVPVTVPPLPELSIDDLQALQLRQRDHKDRVAAKQRFDAIDQSGEHLFVEEFNKQKVEVTENRNEALGKKTELGNDIARWGAQIITATHCGLCDKDLSAVPEVVSKNQELRGKIASAQAALGDLEVVIARWTQKLQKLGGLGELDLRLRHTQILCVEVSTNTVPPTLVWIGGELGEPDGTDYTTAIKAVTAAKAAYDSALARNAYVAEQKLNKQAKLALVPNLEALDADRVLIAESRAFPVELAKAKTCVTNAEMQKTLVENRIVVIDENYRLNLEAYEGVQKQVVGLRNDIAMYQFHNTIIDKLRAARPVVARQLWGAVLAGVSHYLSLIRGKPSTVTRTDDAFLIDGKPVSSYSGSAKDSLGLAIRVMLQKTFLSSVDMMLLDEVAAACDDTRESDMLGMLASCGIRQVVLVTHSSLADSFAANVITI